MLRVEFSQQVAAWQHAQGAVLLVAIVDVNAQGGHR
jgi:hypothetical protein